MIVDRCSPVSPSQMRTVASVPAVAIHRPSGLHSTSLVPRLSPRSVNSSVAGVGVDHGGARLVELPGCDRDPLPVGAERGARRARDLDLGDRRRRWRTSITRTTSSGHDAASRDPSGLNDGASTLTSRPLAPSVLEREQLSPVAGSHTRTAPSSPVVASIDPSLLNATSLTSTSCPWNERTDVPVSASRMSIRPDSSGPSVTKMVPSGLQSSAPPTPGKLSTTR